MRQQLLPPSLGGSGVHMEPQATCLGVDGGKGKEKNSLDHLRRYHATSKLPARRMFWAVGTYSLMEPGG